MTTTVEKPADDGRRSTADRTRAATAARRAQAAQRAARKAALELGTRQVELLDDHVLLALVAALLGEAQRRGLLSEPGRMT